MATFGRLCKARLQLKFGSCVSELRKSHENHTKIKRKSNENQFKINSSQFKIHSKSIQNPFPNYIIIFIIFCMKNTSPGSHFESKMASKTHPKTYSKFHRFFYRFWKTFWLPFSSIWRAKFLPKRIQAAPGAQAGSKSLPRSLRTPKMLQK